MRGKKPVSDVNSKLCMSCVFVCWKIFIGGMLEDASPVGVAQVVFRVVWYNYTTIGNLTKDKVGL